MNTSSATEEVIEIEITAAAHGGDGVGRIAGMVCFVSGALPGDTVRARIVRRSPRAAWAEVESVLTPSPYRESTQACAECPGACAWRAFAYPAQADWKRRIVADSLERIGGIQTEVAWLEQAEYRLGYRTRAVFHGDGTTIGYFVPRTHMVVPMEACPLNHARLNDAFQRLQMPGIRGDIQVAVNPEGQDIMVFLRDEAAALKEHFPQTNTRLDRVRHQFMFDGVPVVNGVFSQSSLLLNRMLRAHTDACIGGAGSLLDLYCGNGNLSLHHAGSARVVSAAHAGAAIRAAASLAPGVYIEGEEAHMARLLKKQSWEVILLDPPRTGARALVEALAAARAQKIVYVSCDPATLARDLRGIMAAGWSLTQATVVDMFPYTPHVETVCVLEQ